MMEEEKEKEKEKEKEEKKEEEKGEEKAGMVVIVSCLSFSPLLFAPPNFCTVITSIV